MSAERAIGPYYSSVKIDSRREWRRTAKRERRRRLRRRDAKRRCARQTAENLAKQEDAKYRAWILEQERLETFKILEIEKIHQEENEKWLQREVVAQQQWRELQDKLTRAQFHRAQQDLKIRKEWEEEQNKIKEAEKARKLEEERLEERLQCHEELMKRIEQFTCGERELPKELCVILETNPGKEICQFFAKIGMCRFGDACSRNHRKPTVSKILLARNFYMHFGMEHAAANEYDSDILLEYDDKETYMHFKEFYNDVFPEFQRIGTVTQFKVCCNFERHLRGNTYIEYSTLAEAVKAYRLFHGRWYGGKQISLQFCDIPSWRQAICGLFDSKRCPKGKSCNFLHVFQDPGSLSIAYKQRNGCDKKHRKQDKSGDVNNRKYWRWSETPDLNLASRTRDFKRQESPKYDNYKKKIKKRKRSPISDELDSYKKERYRKLSRSTTHSSNRSSHSQFADRSSSLNRVDSKILHSCSKNRKLHDEESHKRTKSEKCDKILKCDS